MTKLQEILEELVKNCNYRHNVSPNNYLLYKQESIAQAKAKIEEMFGEWIGEDRNMPSHWDLCLLPSEDRATEEGEIDGYNQAIQEIRNRVKEGK